jgi:hypothetical protein
MLEKLKVAKQMSSYKQNKDDIAEMVMLDLREAGFECKYDGKHITPSLPLTPHSLKKFNKIKDEATVTYREARLEQLREIRKALFK